MGRVWVQSYSPTRCGGRSRAPARSDLLWSWSMLWTSRRPASTPRMGSCDCPIHVGWCCRCVLRMGWLNDDVRIRAATEPREAPAEAKRRLLQHPGKHGGIQRGLLRRGAAGPTAACRDGRKSWLSAGAHAEGCPKPAILRLLLLPPGFPGSSVRSGEAKNGPEGPLYAADFPEKIWSGRRDSNPRPQPWQGCALPLSYARAATDLAAFIRRP